MAIVQGLGFKEHGAACGRHAPIVQHRGRQYTLHAGSRAVDRLGGFGGLFFNS